MDSARAIADGFTKTNAWKWIPNVDPEMDAEFAKEVDPGGGRFRDPLSCGLGHYR